MLSALVAVLAATTLIQRADAVGVVASWTVGHQPFSVAVDPADGRVYVSNSGAVGPNRTGTLSVVNPATGLVTSLTTTGVSDTVAIDPAARRLYAANAEGPGLDVFDLSSGNLITSLAVGGIGVAVDVTTHRIYTTRAGSLSVVDGVTNTVVGSKASPSSELWFDVVPDPDLHRLYVSNVDQTRPTLVVLDDRDLSTLTEVVMPQPIRWALAVDPSNHNIYVGGSDPTGPPFGHSSFFVIDPTSFTITHTTPLTGFPAGIAVASATQRIFMTDLSGNRVVELDPTTFAVTQTIVLPWGPARPTMHPDGRLYVPAYQGAGADLLAAIDVELAAPVVDSVTLYPDQPRTNDTVQATVVAHDSQGRPLSQANLTYEWLRNGVVIAGPPGPTTPWLDLRGAGAGDRGDTITARVTASDGGRTSAPRSASVVVQDSAPTAGVMLANGTPTTNATLTAASTALDPDNDPLSYSFTWKVSGVVHKTTSGPNPSDTFDLSVAGNGNHGDVVTVEVAVSDGVSSSTASATAVVANTPPTATVYLSSSTPATNDVLYAGVLAQDVDGDALSLNYTWRVNGAVKRTVTTTARVDRFDLSVKGNGDKRDVVTVTVTVSDGTANSAPTSASATVR